MSGIVSAMMQQSSQLNKNKMSSIVGAALTGAQPATQAQIQAKAMGQGSVGNAAAVSNPAPAGSADTGGLEARIAALESGVSNTAESTVQAATPPPSTPSSMSPGALAAGEAIFGTQDQRNSSINPFNSALI